MKRAFTRESAREGVWRAVVAPVDDLALQWRGVRQASRRRDFKKVLVVPDADAFVNIFLLVVEPNAAGAVVEHIRRTGQQRVASLQGFRRMAALISDDETHIVVISEWNARHDWARAQWD
jgi:hypothetical protein